MSTEATRPNEGTAVSETNNEASPARRTNPQFGAELFASLPQSVFMMFMFHVIFMTPSNPAARQSLPSAPGVKIDPRTAVGPAGPQFALHSPLWKLEEKFEMFVYLSATNETLPRSPAPSEQDASMISDRSTDSAASFLPGVLSVKGKTLLWHEVHIADPEY
jgi:hypothetical protein